MDIFIEVPPVDYEKLAGDDTTETSSQVGDRVKVARDVQLKQFQDTPFTCNSEMGPAEVWKYCHTEESAKGLLQTAMNQLTLSAGAFHRILKLSLTIADLAGSDVVSIAHLAEALQYRPRS